MTKGAKGWLLFGLAGWDSRRARL